MCGICGIHDPAGAAPERLRRMAAALRHRGPDDEGYFVGGPVGLGHRRLSIIDLEHGRQPLSNEDGSIWIAFNGEIYNHPELRRDLEARGHRFATRTDTETIVHLYEEHGERCVERLRGMFAFAIWDGPRRRLFLARDRLGQKPLFYAHSGARLRFASEVKGILADEPAAPAPDLAALHGYLALRFVPSPLTMFDGIASLPPAHTLTFDGENVVLRRYWELRYRPKWTGDEPELADRLTELLRDSVGSHLLSDVPVGAFLSGGIDSGLVTALAVEAAGAGLPSFTVGSDADDYSEAPAARELARVLGTDHHEEIVRPDLFSLLPEMVRHLDMPGDPIAACQYHASRVAARHVKVALGGDGGDELFAGYDRMAGFGAVDVYAGIPRMVRRRLIGPALTLLRDSFTYKSPVAKLRWLHELSFHEDGARYGQATTYFRFDRRGLTALYAPELIRRLGHIDPVRPVIDAFDAADADEALDRMLHADATTRLPEHLLILLDRMSMAHSLEARSPLLDHEVAEFAARLPVEMKVRRHRLKVIQRRVAARFLPAGVANAPKRGFMFPIAYWLKGELRHTAEATLLGSRLIADGWLRRDAIQRLLLEHRTGRVDHHHRIWMLLNLEIWFRHYLGGESVADLSDSLRRAAHAAAPAAAG